MDEKRAVPDMKLPPGYIQLELPEPPREEKAESEQSEIDI